MTHTQAPPPTDYLPATPYARLLVEADTPTDWLIEGIWPEQALVLLHGPTYTGKSYVVTDMAVSLALGLDWHGHTIDRPRSVLLVLSEGRKGYSKRVASAVRWKASNSPEVAAILLEDGLALYRHDEPFMLDPKAKGVALKPLAYLGKEIERLEIDVVIFDVWGDFTRGLDENSRDMGHALKMVAPDALPGKPSTLLVHHEGYSAKGRARGHSSMPAGADVDIAVEVAVQDNPDQPTRSVLRLSNVKQKEEDAFKPFGLVLQRPDSDLQRPVIVGAVPLAGGNLAEGVGGSGQPTGNQATVLAAILDLSGCTDKENPGRVRTSPVTAVVTQADIHRATGLNRQRVSDAVKALKEADHLDASMRPTEQALAWAMSGLSGSVRQCPDTQGRHVSGCPCVHRTRTADKDSGQGEADTVSPEAEQKVRAILEAVS